MKLAFILDPLDQLKTAKDSSLAIMHEAINRGHQVFVSLQHDLFLGHGQAKLVSKPWAWNGHTAVVGESQESLPTAFDAIIMRKDPPFDNEYLYSTYLLEIAANQGAKVYNSPSAMRDWNEKLSVTRFIDLVPASLVTANNGLLREFLQEQQDIVVKPLDGMGGSSVFRLKTKDPNLGVILETVTDFGRRTIMAQRYLPEILQGDKRIIMIGGEPLPYATLMYVWSNQRPVDSVIVNARTDRVRKWVVESGAARLKQWVSYQRDVRADFEKAFGEAPGHLVGIAIMTDSDNTRSNVRAWYGDIRFD